MVGVSVDPISCLWVQEKNRAVVHPWCRLDPRSQTSGKGSIQHISLVAVEFAATSLQQRAVHSHLASHLVGQDPAAADIVRMSQHPLALPMVVHMYLLWSLCDEHMSVSRQPLMHVAACRMVSGWCRFDRPRLSRN